MKQTYVYQGQEVKLTGRVARPKVKVTQSTRRREIQSTPSVLVEVETVSEYEQIKRMWVNEDDLYVVQSEIEPIENGDA